jgi:hypothetical protein
MLLMRGEKTKETKKKIILRFPWKWAPRKQDVTMHRSFIGHRIEGA